MERGGQREKIKEKQVLHQGAYWSRISIYAFGQKVGGKKRRFVTRKTGEEKEEINTETVVHFEEEEEKRCSRVPSLT